MGGTPGPLPIERIVADIFYDVLYVFFFRPSDTVIYLMNIIYFYELISPDHDIRYLDDTFPVVRSIQGFLGKSTVSSSRVMSAFFRWTL